MKATLSHVLLVPAIFLMSSQAATPNDVSRLMNDVTNVLEGSKLIVDTPSPTNYTHLVKTYTHVSSTGCVLKYVETADESGKMAEGQPQTRHSTYTFTVDLSQASGPAKDPLTRGQRSDHLYYSVPMAYSGEQSILQQISTNGGETVSAQLKHTTASFEVEGQDHAVKLQGALNAAIQACTAK